MVARNTPATSAAPTVGSPPRAPASVPAGEHIYIESEDSSANPATAARTLRENVVLRNSIRRVGAELALFEEGVLRVTPLRRSDADEPFFLDLRFLDPVPKLERVIAVRWLTSTLGCGALMALAAFLMRFDALYVFAAVALGVAATAATVTFYLGLYLSHERTEFCTLHGRATVLELVANLGSVKKFRAFVPTLSQAIEEAAERIGSDTAAYLRGEMREHYRLRGDGVLDHDECARGTGRILAQFDVQL
jgi:hypothetical protein